MQHLSSEQSHCYDLARSPATVRQCRCITTGPSHITRIVARDKMFGKLGCEPKGAASTPRDLDFSCQVVVTALWKTGYVRGTNFLGSRFSLKHRKNAESFVCLLITTVLHPTAV